MKGVKDLLLEGGGGLHTSNNEHAEQIETFASLISGAFSVTSTQELKQPLQSVAETLPELMDYPPGTSNVVCCTAPCMRLKPHESAAFYPRSSKPVLEDAAATNMRHAMEFTPKDLPGLPMALLWNLTKSFIFLVDARLRSTVAALVRQSNRSGGVDRYDSISQLLVQFLMASSSNHAISPSAVVTSYRTLAFSERTVEGDVVLPLVAEAVLDMEVFGTCVTVAVEAPGTIQAGFSIPRNGNRSKMRHVEIVMDTSALLHSMMSQARSVVKKAIAVATDLVTRELALSQTVRRTMSTSRLGSSSIDSNSGLFGGESSSSLRGNHGNHGNHNNYGSSSNSSFGTLSGLHHGRSSMSTASSLPSLLHMAAEQLQEREDSHRKMVVAAATAAAMQRQASAGASATGNSSSSSSNSATLDRKRSLMDALMPPPPARGPSLTSMRASSSSNLFKAHGQPPQQQQQQQHLTDGLTPSLNAEWGSVNHSPAPGSLGLSLLTDVVSRLKRESSSASAILNETTASRDCLPSSGGGNDAKKSKTLAAVAKVEASPPPSNATQEGADEADVDMDDTPSKRIKQHAQSDSGASNQHKEGEKELSVTTAAEKATSPASSPAKVEWV